MKINGIDFSAGIGATGAVGPVGATGASGAPGAPGEAGWIDLDGGDANSVYIPIQNVDGGNANYG